MGCEGGFVTVQTRNLTKAVELLSFLGLTKRDIYSGEHYVDPYELLKTFSKNTLVATWHSSDNDITLRDFKQVLREVDELPDEEITFEDLIEDLLTSTFDYYYNRPTTLQILVAQGAWMFSIDGGYPHEKGFRDPHDKNWREQPWVKMKVKEWKKQICECIMVDTIKFVETWT